MAKLNPTELSPITVERITRVVRSLAEDRVDRGVDSNKALHCSSCEREQSAVGAARYGSYQLCNDCLLDFTLALASGQVENIADYMTKRTEVPEGSIPPEAGEQRERTALPFNPLYGRDKLMPRNEPC